jgi:hypothetical protein
MDRDEYDEILRTLVGIVAHQRVINDDIRATLGELRGITTRLTALMEDVFRGRRNNGQEA